MMAWSGCPGPVSVTKSNINLCQIVKKLDADGMGPSAMAKALKIPRVSRLAGYRLSAS
jgi:hypothetical protein